MHIFTFFFRCAMALAEFQHNKSHSMLQDPNVNNPPASGEWINGSSTQRRASVSKPPIEKIWYQWWKAGPPSLDTKHT